MGLGTDGLRGELTLIRAARALASLDGDRRSATGTSAAWPRRPCAIGCGATPSTRAGSTARVERAVAEFLPA
jgi:magnesium chelatase subunit I